METKESATLPVNNLSNLYDSTCHARAIFECPPSVCRLNQLVDKKTVIKLVQSVQLDMMPIIRLLDKKGHSTKPINQTVSFAMFIHFGQ